MFNNVNKEGDKMSTENKRIDLSDPYTAEQFPRMFPIISKYFPTAWPGRDIVADPVRIEELLDGVIIPLSKECKFELDSADSTNEFSEDTIVEMYSDFFPDMILYEGIFHFRTEEQLMFCKMKYF